MFKLSRARSKQEKSGLKPGELSLEEYDPQKHGPLVEFNGVEGYQEVERYWLEKPYSMAVILYDPDRNQYLYQVCEPKLDEYESAILSEFKQKLRDILMDAPPPESQDQKLQLIQKYYNQLIQKYKINISIPSYHKIRYYLVRDFVNFERITPLMRDPLIEDISCDGWGTNVFLYHKNYTNIPTNIRFGREELDSFVVRLAQRAGKHISFANPLVDATLMDGSRIQMSFGKEVTTRGSTFCIADGYVMLGNGELIKIQELFEIASGNSILEQGSTQIAELGLDVVEVDAGLNPALGKAVQIIKLVPDRELVRLMIKEASRYHAQVEVTQDHLFYVLDSRLELRAAAKLNPGDWIVVPSRLPDPRDPELDLTYPRILLEEIGRMDSSKRVFVILDGTLRELVEKALKYPELQHLKPRMEHGLRYGFIRYSVLDRICRLHGFDLSKLDSIKLKSYRSKPIKLPLKLDPDLSYVLGLILSDGSLSQKNVDISIRNPKFADYVIEKLNRLFEYQPSKYCNGTRICIIGYLLPWILNKVFGIPYGKSGIGIPSIIQRAGGDILAAFIRGKFDADGGYDGRSPYIKSSSRELLDQLQFHLLRYGIYSLRTSDQKLSIPETYLEKFLKSIKPYRIPNKIKNKIGSNKLSHKLPASVIQSLARICSRNGMSLSELSRSIGADLLKARLRGYLSFQVLRRALDFLKCRSIPDPELEYLEWLIDGSKQYLQISKVEFIPPKPVYDLVCNPHCFFIGGPRPLYVHDTIRKFREVPFTPVDLIKLGTFSSEIMAYLWICIENNKSMIFAGGTASGKSIPYQERVVIYRRGIPELIRIGELFEEISARSQIHQRDGYQIARCEDEILVPCFSPQLKIELGRLRSVIRHKSPQKIYRITTSSGRIVMVTGDHSVFVLRDSRIINLPVSQLIRGDHLAVPKLLPPASISQQSLDLIQLLSSNSELYIGNAIEQLEYSIERLGINKVSEILEIDPSSILKMLESRKAPIQLPKFLKLVKHGVPYDPGRLRIGSNTWMGSQIPAKIELGRDLMRLVGYLMAGGRFESHGLRFSFSNPQIRADLMEISQRLFGLKLYSGNPSRLFLNSKPLRYLMQCLGLKRGCIDEIPEMVFSQSNPNLAEFLRAYFSGDGNINGSTLEIATKSQMLSEKLMYALLRFEIFPRLKIKHNGNFRIIIKGLRNLARFQSQIGFSDSRNHDKLREILRKYSNTHLETIPNIALGNASGLANGGAQRRCQSYWHEVENPRKYVQDPPTSCHPRPDSQIFWDRISKIETLDRISEYVYDLEVDPHQNFVGGFGGVFLHNTTSLNAVSLFIPHQAKIVCLSPDMKILLNGHIASISEFVDDQLSTNASELKLESNRISGRLEASPRAPRVEGFDPASFELVPQPISMVTELLAPSNLIKITTQYGAYVVTTPNTKLPLLRSGPEPKFEFVPSREVREGDWVVQVSKISLEESPPRFDPIEFAIQHGFQICLNPHFLRSKESSLGEVAKFLEELGWGRSWLYRSKISANKLARLAAQLNLDPSQLNSQITHIAAYGSRMPKIDSIPPELFYAAGIIFSDGNLSGNSIIFENRKNIQLIQELSEILSKWFGIRPKLRSNRLEIHSKLAVEFFSDYFQIPKRGKSHGISLPRIVLNAPPSEALAFIKGYIQGDGGINRSSILIYSRSREFLEQLSFVLLRFGVLAEFLEAISPQIQIHALRIGGIYRNRLAELLQVSPAGLRRRKSSDQMLPAELGRILHRLICSHGVSNGQYLSQIRGELAHLFHDPNRKLIPRGKLLEILSRLEDHLSGNPEFELIRKILNQTQLVLARVRSIEEINHHPNFVYDITPSFHRYFPAGRYGFIIVEDTIEDTRELQLPHPNWIPGLTRDSFTPDGTGAIDMYELLRAALRQRPEYIIVGEVRGREALTLFQAMSSVAGSTPILIKIPDGSIRLVEIGEFVDRFYSGDEQGIPKPVEGYQVLSLDPQLRINFSPIGYVLRHRADRIYEIEYTGGSILATGEHSVFILDQDGEIKPVRVDELEPGDFLVSFLGSDIQKHNPTLDLVEILGNDPWVTQHDGMLVPKKKQRAGGKLPLKLSVDPLLGFMLGVYLADGSIHGNTVSFSLGNSEKIQVIPRLIQALSRFGNPKILNRGSHSMIRINHGLLARLLSKLCGSHGSEKHLPDFIWDSDSRIVEALLEGYRCDSRRKFSRNYISYTSANGGLIQQVCWLARLHGFHSWIQRDPKYPSVNVHRLFSRKAPSSCALPTAPFRRLKLLLKPRYKRIIYERLYQDTLSKPKAREVLDWILSQAKLPLSHEANRILSNLRALLDSKLGIAKITKITSKPYRGYVYDVSVPGTEAFLGGDVPVVLHNTGHTTYSTIHADSIDRVIHRLENPPISVPRSLIEALNLVSVQAQVWIGGKRARRCTSLVEITELDPQTRTLKTIEIFKWDPVADRHINVGISHHLEEIRMRRGWSRAELSRELERRQRIFHYMIDNNISNFDQVARIIHMYQTTPDKVLEMIGI